MADKPSEKIEHLESMRLAGNNCAACQQKLTITVVKLAVPNNTVTHLDW